MLLMLALLTWRQGETCSDAETIWRATIARNPGSFLAHFGLGNILLEKEKVDEVIVLFQ